MQEPSQARVDPRSACDLPRKSSTGGHGQLRELRTPGAAHPDYLEGAGAIFVALDSGIAAISLATPFNRRRNRCSASASRARSAVKPHSAPPRGRGRPPARKRPQRGGESAGPRQAELKGIRRALQAIADRTLEQVAAAYDRERGAGAGPEQRQIEKVRRLLDGEEVDAHDLAYDFDLHHVGLIASGPQAPAAIAELARRADRRRLSVRLGQRTVWAWLGSRDPETLPERKLLIAPAPAAAYPTIRGGALRRGGRLAADAPPGQGGPFDPARQAAEAGPLRGVRPRRLDPGRRAPHQLAAGDLPEARSRVTATAATRSSARCARTLTPTGGPRRQPPFWA